MRLIDEAEKLFQGEIVELARPECLRLLAQSRVGRVAVNDADGPLVAPVNGRTDGVDVYFRLREGSLLAAALADGRASYEIDGFDEFRQAGWSVLVRGDAHRISPEDLPEHRSEWPRPWAAGERDVWIRLSGDTISGRRLQP
ncbi:pyridoxamine 5'-phosphate oxidase family protein [Nocardioides jiangxiensis]|uniref:Pyridoxamine 5'-phosphate oxidase family protein n=1 Tax=Nocardioides jiangxiensis TaxID=3064524 RepID=A0ABT9AYB8_9ACTN|nr:pyridoxamine 5'-phosphate oxidase family protein [Nocardioides sp. WY-20]MDO7867060.1 pyridoxamine 5'-phosphate oxidase family protein [Nocardioides sp. WY-20]